VRIIALDQVGDGHLLVERHAVDLCDGLLAREALLLRIEPEFGADHLDQVFAVGPVHDRERRLEIDFPAVVAEHGVGEGMECPAGDFVAAAVHQKTGAAEHLLGGSAREREQQDRARIDADVDQPRHAIHERAGFAGAGAGDDEARTLDGRRGGELRVI
jgi:hypothetical protein